MHERLSRMESLLSDEISADSTHLDLNHNHKQVTLCSLRNCLGNFAVKNDRMS